MEISSFSTRKYMYWKGMDYPNKPSETNPSSTPIKATNSQLRAQALKDKNNA
jgi:hypothetical protein